MIKNRLNKQSTGFWSNLQEYCNAKNFYYLICIVVSNNYFNTGLF